MDFRTAGGDARMIARREVEHMQKVVNFAINPDSIKIEAICNAVTALAAVILEARDVQGGAA